MVRRRVKSIKNELLIKSKESALSAVSIFNNPLIKFKSETFIVLMVIAWTYLLHAYFRSKHVEYRYYKQHGKRRFFAKTKDGAYKYWELEKCLNDSNSPVDKNATNNLRLLIGLRHEIEHQMTMKLDIYISDRYQACIMNYNALLEKLFGSRHSLKKHLSYSLQFLELSDKQLSGTKLEEAEIPRTIREYITRFENNLTQQECNNSNYSYRVSFVRKMVNRPGQADRVINFINSKSDLAEEVNKKNLVVQKEVERTKYKPSSIVRKVQEAGFTKFRLYPDHTNMWKREKAKTEGNGYGAWVAGVWYWYDTWLKHCLELCEAEGDRYR